MRRVTTRSVVTVSCFVFPLIVIAFILGLQPTLAQEPVSSSENMPERVVPPHMDYQVPSKADELSDFVPPGVDTSALAPTPNQPLLSPSIGASGLAVSIGERLAVIVEEDTFSQPTCR